MTTLSYQSNSSNLINTCLSNVRYSQTTRRMVNIKKIYINTKCNNYTNELFYINDEDKIKITPQALLRKTQVAPSFSTSWKCNISPSKGLYPHFPRPSFRTPFHGKITSKITKQLLFGSHSTCSYFVCLLVFQGSYCLGEEGRGRHMVRQDLSIELSECLAA